MARSPKWAVESPIVLLHAHAPLIDLDTTETEIGLPSGEIELEPHLVNVLAHHLQEATPTVPVAVIFRRDDDPAPQYHTDPEIEHPREKYPIGDLEREQEHRHEQDHRSERGLGLQEPELLLAQELRLEQEHRLGDIHQREMMIAMKDQGHVGEMILVEETQGE
jgi:hypothetical protein